MKLNIRRHLYLAPMIAAFLLFSILILGNTRIIAYAPEGGQTYESPGYEYEGNSDLLDTSIIHSIEIELSQEDLDSMIRTYKETGRKDYFQTNIIIDGTSISNVGIRLKGNSSLRDALGIQPDPAPPMENNGGPMMRPPQPPPGPQGMNQGPGQAPGPPGPDEREERNIPFLIKLDYLSDQSYQGHRELALRVRGHLSQDDALLSELVTQAAYDRAGLKTPSGAYCTLSIAGGDEQLYVVNEHYTEDYLENIFEGKSGNIILYKSQAQSQFMFLGNDPSKYENMFEQKTNRGDDDFSQLIEFIEFVQKSSDEDFVREIGERFDVPSFLSYLALNTVFVNMDSLGGNGNNYYLAYLKDEKKFYLLPWDLNESFGQFWFSREPAETLPIIYESQFPHEHPLYARILSIESYMEEYKKLCKEYTDYLAPEGFIHSYIDELSKVFYASGIKRQVFSESQYGDSLDWAREFISGRYRFLVEGIFK
jgi:spore coat protein CotH